eukprot:Platyproteum_vivax@DN16149_c0_g1_i1.p1
MFLSGRLAQRVGVFSKTPIPLALIRNIELKAVNAEGKPVRKTVRSSNNEALICPESSAQAWDFPSNLQADGLYCSYTRHMTQVKQKKKIANIQGLKKCDCGWLWSWYRERWRSIRRHKKVI